MADWIVWGRDLPLSVQVLKTAAIKPDRLGEPGVEQRYGHALARDSLAPET